MIMKHGTILQTIIASTNICFLSSVNKDGFPVTRAMLKPIKMEKDILYLHTNTASNKVQQFIANPKACLYVCNEDTFQGVTLLGTMALLTNEEKRSFWKEEYQPYYAKGEGLSDFTVLQFTMLQGAYYHNFNVENF